MVNLSGFFQNINNQITTPNSNAGNTGALTDAGVTQNPQQPVTGENAGLALLKNMLAGDTFSGKILTIDDMKAMLQLGDGSQVLAHLTDGANVNVGDTLTFMIANNDNNNIAIKPLMKDAQQAVLINKALDAAGLVPSEANIDIVKELLSLNMPVSSDEIAAMVKYSNKFPEGNLNTIANLLRLDMPVTQENITQFEAYKTYEHSILGKLDDIGGNIKNLFEGLVSDDRVNNEILQGVKLTNSSQSAISGNAALLNELVDIFYTDVELNEAAKNTPVNEIISEDGFLMLNEALKNAADKYADNEDVLTLLKQLQTKTADTKDLLTKVTGLIKNNPKLSEDLKDFIGSADFKKLVDEMINQTMKLTPSDISEHDGINKFYRRMKNNIEKAIETANGSNSAKELANDMSQIKSNIDFMNDLNKNMTFFQMPIKFSESATNGELYVFTNKKALANNPDNVSALLHLDMENLGPMDIYVKLMGKNVSTNFCLETEELLDFVYSHIDKLNARLEAMGYSCEFKMQQSDDKKFDMMKDFVAPQTNQLTTSQYILDLKA